MTKIIWEDRWHDYPDVPAPGDYIQVKVQRVEMNRIVPGSETTLEGMVSEVRENGWFTLIPDPLADIWCWDRWRRGALPEHRSVVRRKTVDA